MTPTSHMRLNTEGRIFFASSPWIMMALSVFSMQVRMKTAMSLLSMSMISTAVLLLYPILLCAGNTAATSGVGSSSPAAYAKEIRLSTAQEHASLVSSFLRDVAMSERFVSSDRIVGLHILSFFSRHVSLSTWDPQFCHADAIV